MLSDLRKSLGAAILIEDENLALAADTVVDVRLFESALVSVPADMQAVRTALSFYRGDFLNDFALANSSGFDDWAATERERYRHLAVKGLTTISQYEEAQQDYTAALDALLRALIFDPLQEDLQRTCMRLQYVTGDRVGATRRYDTLYKLLDAEIGVPPMAETRALYDAILNDTLKGAIPAPAKLYAPQPVKIASTALPFTGRVTELEILRHAAVPGKLIMIEGEPGIGKTRLAGEFLVRFQQARADPDLPMILRGRAYELEQGLPYQPIIDALRNLLNYPQWPLLRVRIPPAWVAEITRLVPELAAVPGSQLGASPTEEARLWEAICQTLMTLASEREVILFLDDLHWADASSLALLGYLVRRCNSLVILTTARTTAPQTRLVPLLQALMHEGPPLPVIAFRTHGRRYGHVSQSFQPG